MDGLVISRENKQKIIRLINTFNTYAHLEHPREAMTKIFLARDVFLLHEQCFVIRELAELISNFYLDFYRQYPALWT